MHSNISDHLFLLPIYLGFNEWENDFNSLKVLLSENHNKNIIVVGDLNGRISNEQELLELDYLSENFYGKRMSKDNVINTNGRRLLKLFEDTGHIVLNGRTPGDCKGEYTFISSVGMSVIDLAVVPIGVLSKAYDFKVISHAGSDHMPIELCVKMSEARGEERLTNNLNLLPRLKWSERNKKYLQTECR